eukprot:TRINITY_DN18519_c0_g1_i1.p1 TRINITY_DN18519_c0_g1~~TRINITY_DN18519_c0_g1_i1.p1  ORF type:complete len:470 (-),score=57.33 TRINITY_DN18519_c0_g1_i1:339-1592(-)
MTGPSDGPRALAWRKSPYRLLPKIIQEPRCGRPVEFPKGVCLQSGSILLPPSSSKSELQFCTEFGGFDWRPQVMQSELSWKSLVEASSFNQESVLFIIPVGTAFVNLWHALNWWIPTLATKHFKGWKNDQLRLGIVFDSKSDDGKPRWQVEDDAQVLQEFLTFHRSILSVITGHAPIFVDRTGDKPECFYKGLAGIDTIRYDMKVPKAGKNEIAAFRTELLQVAPAGGSFLDQSCVKTGALKSQAQVSLIRRRAGQPRFITNLWLLERALQRHPRACSRGYHMEELNLMEQFTVLSNTDVLIGAHGAGLAWLVAMRPGSFVIEAMPADLPGFIICIDSWNHPRNVRDSIYGGLSRISHQHHICLRGNRTSGSEFAVPDTLEVNNFREHPIELPLGLFLRRTSEAIVDVLARARNKDS